jgi:hypothetical protein
LEPRVSKNILDNWSLVWVLMEDLLQKLTCLARDVVWKRQLLLANVAVQLFVILAFEREPTAKEGVKQNTQGPDISWWTGILDLAYNLGCHV